MATGKRKRTALPKLTILAYSKAELQRFSEAAEQVVGLAHLMVGLMTRLDACVTRLEARTAAAHKANRTRKQQAGESSAEVEQPPPDELPSMDLPPHTEGRFADPH